MKLLPRLTISAFAWVLLGGGLLLLLPGAAAAQCGFARTADAITGVDVHASGWVATAGTRTALFDSTGERLWRKDFFSEAVAISVDRSVLVGGFFVDSLLIDSSWQAGSPGTNAYWARFSSTGELLWFNHFGGVDTAGGIGNAITAMAFHPDGSLWLTGFFRDTVQIGNDTLAALQDSGDGSQPRDVFLLRVDSTSGQVLQVFQGGGKFDDEAADIAIDPQGRVYITGTFADSATFGQDTIRANRPTVVGTPGDYRDAFLASFQFGQGWRWARNGGGTLNNVCPGDAGRAVFADSLGGIWWGGSIHPQAYFDSLFLNAGGSACTPKAFVARYDTLGNPLWASEFGGNGLDDDNAVETIFPSPGGGVFVGGRFSGAGLFGPDTLFSADSSSDIFLLKLDTAGNQLQARRYGYAGYDVLAAGGRDTADFYVLAGVFNDSLELAGEVLQGSGGFNDGYLSRWLASDTLLPFTLPSLLSYPCGDTLQFLPARYDSSASYAWAPATGLSDSLSPTPLLFTDTTQHYSLSVAHPLCQFTHPVRVRVDSAAFGLGFTVQDSILDSPPYSTQIINLTLDTARYDFRWYSTSGDSALGDWPQMTFSQTGIFSITQIATLPGTRCRDTLQQPNSVVVYLQPLHTGAGLPGRAAWQVYPNPFETEINLRGPLPASGVRLQLLEPGGRVVWQKRLQNAAPSGVAQLYLPQELPTGVYLLRVSNPAEGKARTFRLTKR